VNVHESGDYRATSLETLRQMVAAGHGITLLPEMALHGPYGDARNLVVRPFAKPVPRRRIGAVWRRSSTRLPAIEAVCDTIANAPRR
jgi:LysR family transcriptional regulator, hydrogen peroxide-inducible genes activator